MSPQLGILLEETAHRLARRLTGHPKNCGCATCVIFGDCLKADNGLQEALTMLCAEATSGRRKLEARRVLLALATGTALPSDR